MSHRGKDIEKWRWVTFVSAGFAIILGAMHITGLPSGGEYVTTAHAAQTQARNDIVHKELKEEQTEIIKLLHRILGKLDND